MLEIKGTIGAENTPPDYHLYVDGIKAEGVQIEAFPTADDLDGIISVSTVSQAATDRLLEYSFTQLNEVLGGSLRLLYEVSWNEAAGQLWCLMNSETKETTLGFVLDRISRWRRPYTFEEYYDALTKESKNSTVQTRLLEIPQSEDTKGPLPYLNSRIICATLICWCEA
jgi:hypothetical protein